MWLDSFLNKYWRWSHNFCLFIFSLSSFSRNYSPVTSQANTGMSSYLTSMSPVMDHQQQIMWPVNGQNDEFLTARSGKLPEFHRFQSSTSFVNPPKNTHYAPSFCVQVRSIELRANFETFYDNYSLNFPERLEYVFVIDNCVKRAWHKSAHITITLSYSATNSWPTSSATFTGFTVAFSQWVVF